MNDERASADADSPVRAGEKKRATIYDVARLAEVSHQTVSRHLRGFEGIRPETRQRVEDALKKLDYRPNMTARSLATNRSHRVAALTHDLAQVGPSRTAQGASDAAREAGYLLDLISLDLSDRRSLDDAMVLLSGQDVAGILALSSTDEMTDAFDRAHFRVPVFVVTEDDENPDGDPAGLHTLGMSALVNHLADLGHRRFFHLAGPADWASARNRSAAYGRAIAARGAVSVDTVEGDWSPSTGYSVAMGLPDPPDVTALVVANDQMALGAILALEERGLQVPRDISVVGFDDIPEARYFRPPLTTVKQDFGIQGRAAFARLLRRIEGPSAPAVPTPTVELIVRQSSGPARDRRIG
jgi:DNA-binding LacI/PurR family transcriptional regulator